MRHATPATIIELEPFLEQLRSCQGLVEKRPGVFYRKSRAFLHFHEDPSGLHADVRLRGEFERFRVETEAERSELLGAIRTQLARVDG